MQQYAYVAPVEGKTITIPAGTADAKTELGIYAPGDQVDVFDVVRATLRAVAVQRTPSRHLSADAKRARAELARNKANKAAKRAAAY